MFIRDVDEGLEKLLRARLPLPEHIGDVSFEPPTNTWSAQLSRLTVNLFLYSVGRSNQPTRAPQRRFDANGRPERRGAQSMIELGYMVSAWAGSPRDEHQLLGDVTSLLAGYTALPPEHCAPTLNSTVSLILDAEEVIRPRDVWQGVSGQLKACLMLQVVVAANTWDWEDEAPAVREISVLSSPSPGRHAVGPL